MKEAWGILIGSKIHLKKLSSCLNKIREIMKWYHADNKVTRTQGGGQSFLQ